MLRKSKRRPLGPEFIATSKYLCCCKAGFHWRRSRSSSHNQKRRAIRSSENQIDVVESRTPILLMTPSLMIKWKLHCRSRKQKRKNKFWFRDKGSSIDPQHSAKISPALSCLLEGKSKSSKGTLALSDVRPLHKICSRYCGCLSLALYLEFTRLCCDKFPSNQSCRKKRALKFDWTMKWLLS